MTADKPAISIALPIDAAAPSTAGCAVRKNRV
jgi:hypothetical protein